MNKKIKIGVLGAANIAERYILPAINNLEANFDLIGISSRSLEKAQKIALQFETKAYEGYDSIINNETIEAVYIPLPNSMHFKWAEKALLNGKHVLMEKSLGCTYQEVLHLTNIAIDNKLVLFENFQFRFHPQLNQIINILNKNVIGEIRSLRASFGFPPFKDSQNIRYNSELGGGALLDAGAYTTKISQILLGKELLVKAASLNYNDQYSVDIWGGAFLQNTKTGVFAELSFGFDNFYQCGIEILGTKGKLSTNRLFTSPPGHQPSILLETTTGKETISIDPANHFEQMLLHFYNLVNNVKQMDDEHKNNLDQARLLSEIKKIAHEK